MKKQGKPSFGDMDSFVEEKAPEVKPEKPATTAKKSVVVATKSVPKAKPEKGRVGRPKTNIYATETKMIIGLPKEIHKKLKLKSVELEKPMAELVVTAIKNDLGV